MNARMAPMRRGRVLALGLAAGFGLLGSDPCGPLPGSALSGEVVTEPVTDWSFAAEVRHCQLELQPEEPYSVTTYCYPDGAVIYVPAIMGDDKRWTKLAVTQPEARLRVGDRIYPVTLVRLLEPEERREAALAGHRRRHEGDVPPEDFELDDDTWYFRATSR